MRHYIQSFGDDFSEIFIENDQTRISFSDMGARINRWEIRNESGEWESIILGFDNATHALEGQSYYYGATAGPVAGRISDSQFTLGDQVVKLDANEGVNHLHGGTDSIDIMQWEHEIEADDNQIVVTFSLQLPDGQNGYPGPIDMIVQHTYDANNRWTIKYGAQSAVDTIFNPTNHVYFNLNGNNSASIMNHMLDIQANRYVLVNADGTPEGTIESVEDTPFDLREGVVLEEVLTSDHPQVQRKDGFDHPFVFEGELGVARISLPDQSVIVEMETDRPSVVVYTHYFTDPTIDVWGRELQAFAGVTLEAQALPDAINHDGFGDIVLRAGEIFTSKTTYHLKLN